VTGIPDGMQQMCFAKSYPPIKEKWIVGTGGFFCDCQARGMRQPISRPNHERLEKITRVHIRAARWLVIRRERPVLSRVEGFRLHQGRRGIIVNNSAFRVTAIHDEVNRNTGIHDPHKQTADGTGKTALQPITRIGIANTDGQRSILAFPFGVARVLIAMLVPRSYMTPKVQKLSTSNYSALSAAFQDCY
jgi:hypothetical protein